VISCVCSLQLDEAESGQQIKVKLEEIQSKFLSTDDAWLEILKFVGFQINVSTIKVLIP
jgi:hypothetical protein